MQVCYKAILDVYEEIEQEMRKQRKVFSIKYVKKEVKLQFIDFFFLLFIYSMDTKKLL